MFMTERFLKKAKQFSTDGTCLFSEHNHLPSKKRFRIIVYKTNRRRLSFIAASVHLLNKVNTRVVVVMVVVRELFYFVTLAICVQIRDHRSEVMRIVEPLVKPLVEPLVAQVFVYCCVLTTVDS